MAQIAIDDDTKELLKAASDAHAARLGLSTLSFNQFLRMLLQYWTNTNGKDEK